MAEPVPIWHEDHQAQQPSAFELRPWSVVTRELEASAARLLASSGVSGVAIAQEDPARNGMVCVVSCGSSAPAAGTLLDVSSGISGRCVRENRMLHSYDTLIDPRVNHQACAELGIRSLAIGPLQHNSRCIGVLEVFSDQPGTFDAETRKIVEEEATLLSALLDPRDENELNNSEPTELKDSNKDELASATDQLPMRDLVGYTLAPETTSGITQPLSQNSSLRQTSFLSRGRGRLSAFFLVLAGVLGISAFFSIHNAHRASSRARVSAPVTTVATPVPARVIPQPAETLPSAKSSERETDNVVSAPIRKQMESAASGDVKAQISLADRYRKGDGLRGDKVKAAAWYIIAGAHGSERAKRESVSITHDLPQYEIGEIRFNVGKMYSDGIGGRRDLVSAYSWFALAQAAGDVRAQAEQDKLEHVMTDAQISEAFHRASGWLAAHRTRRHSRETIAAYGSKSP
jgi:hypothetical protein